jgi:hypothetical protein
MSGSSESTTVTVRCAATALVAHASAMASANVPPASAPGNGARTRMRRDTWLCEFCIIGTSS